MRTLLFRMCAVWIAVGFGLPYASGFLSGTSRIEEISAFAQTEEPIAGQTPAPSAEEPTPLQSPRKTVGEPDPIQSPKPSIEVPVGVDPSSPPDSTQYLETLSDLLIDLKVAEMEVKQNRENLDVILYGTGAGSDLNFLYCVQNGTVVKRLSFSGFPTPETGDRSQVTVSVPLNQLKPGNLDIWVGYQEKLGKRYIVSSKGADYLETPGETSEPKETTGTRKEVVKSRPAGKNVEKPEKIIPKKGN